MRSVYLTGAFAAGFLTAASLPALTPFAAAAEKVGDGEAAMDFVAQYCFDCHDDVTQKGERRFDELEFPIQNEMGIIAVQEMIDQLNLGDMPPRKADQPSEEERAAAVAALTAEVADAHTRIASTGGQTHLRRLNEREYLNTLEALFARRVDTFAPTAKFPNDQTAEHLDTIGDALVTSGFLLDNYFEAADLVVEKALGQVDLPEVKRWHFTEKFTQGQELRYSHQKVYNFRYLCVYEVPNTVNHEGGYAGLEQFSEGVHADGLYEVEVLAHSVNRDSHYDPDIFRMDLSQPFRLAVVPGDATVGELHHPQPIEPQLAEVTVSDGKPKWYKMTVWLEKGQSPRFIFPNGMANCRGAFSRIARDYKDEWPEGDAYLKKPGIVEARRVVLEHGKMPHIRMHEVKISGPHFEQWPPRSQRIVFGDEGFRPEAKREILKRFAERAFRRPVADGDLEPYLAIAEQRLEAGHSSRQATLDAIKGMLCSPSFLFLAEPGKGEGERQRQRLAAHDLASRLAYFLTATMPDETLRRLADSGELLESSVLKAQTERLLADSASDAFLDGFLASWLNLRALGDMPPGRDASAVYYYDDLETAMKAEVRHFMRHLIEEDGPITDFLDSDYTFVNQPLAELYRLPQAKQFPRGKAHEFQRVALTDPRRGGLLGMGAVLTVSANGIETSPVVRGVYLLENILGTPPAPPPDDVPALEPDIRGTTTIRDQLDKHRELSTCNSCHVKIDPPGFALENFDPIGRWRDRYPDAKGRPSGPKIDPSGELANGEPFADVVEFKSHLMERRDPFARHLTERLLAYAIGRRIKPLDRPAVDAIVAEAKERGYGMHSLIRAVVASEIFRSR